MRRKIIIEYDNDKPLLPNEHLYYRTHPEYHAENIKSLQVVLRYITNTLIFEPIISQRRNRSTPKCMRTHLTVQRQ